ncbi:MAG: VWA domain-containing protein [Terriglobia bacterium]|nr:VWA domain-containing protein [Terriglobia bacterium]
MKIRLILGCALLSLGICAFAQSSADLPDAPSATIAPKPKPKPPAPAPAQTPQTQNNSTDQQGQPAQPQQPANNQPPAPQAAPGQAPQQDKSADNSADDDSPTQSQSNTQSESSAQDNANPQQPTNASKPSDVNTENPAETITKNVNEVNIVFTVTDKHGRFVKDLKKQDFKVLDDDKPQQILSFRSETDLPLRVGLLIDASNSIRDRFKFEQEAAIEFLNQIIRQRKDEAFVIGFDTVAEVTQDYTDNTENLAHGVRMLRAGGGTALYDAIYYACREKLLNPPSSPDGTRRAIILLSDGDDNQSRVTREEAVEMAQRAGVIIYAISTNITGQKTRGDKVLERFAETTGGRLFTPFKLQEVSDAFTDIQSELRSQYAISYHPTDFVADGRYRTIAIDAFGKKNLKVRAKKGYYAPKNVSATSQNVPPATVNK